MPTGGFAFGPFQLDLAAKRLLRDGAEVAQPIRHHELLLLLVSRAGEIITKDQLLEAVWPGQFITDGSLTQAISQLRFRLDPAHADRYIVTVKGRGYRFVAPVRRTESATLVTDIDAILAPHRALIEGRAALETLERGAIAQARVTFEQVLRGHPQEPMFHVGLANACVLQFEMTRTDPAPDMAALHLAMTHAREACRLHRDYGEAWATLGFVLERTGARVDALAALRRAVSLEPDNWRHHLRLSAVSWGEERLRAARRTLALLPDCPFAHLLAATVYVARDALAEAERELDAGIAAMAGESAAPARFSAVGLHWLKGLLCLARHDDDEALRAFERELALEARGHLYARECCANTWYAIGACHLRRAEPAAARVAFLEAIARVTRHPMVHVGLALLEQASGGHVASAGKGTTPAGARSGHVDLALARAALMVARKDPGGAAGLVAAALAEAPPGNAGWLVRVEPLLEVEAAREAWAVVLGQLRMRAC